MSQENDLHRYQELALKQFQGTITPTEAEELSKWINSDDQHPLEINDPDITNESDHRKKIWKHISKQTQTTHQIIPISIKWIAAASMLLVISIIAYYFSFKKHINPSIVQHLIVNEKLPGKQGAILTLGNGKKIALDSLSNGLITNQNGSRITLNDGQLQYSKNILQEHPEFNTMSTPRGRNYRLLLPDGSKVWLNAASSITYPTIFNAAKREVSITGEVYFEIAKDEKHPFIVRSDNSVTEVLGTHFNINTYSDEPFGKTTLLEGRIRVSQNNHNVIVNPGYQVQIHKNENNNLNLTAVDTELVVAWKKGYFQFKNTNLVDALRELSRWYDIEIVYEGTLPDKRLVGQIPKDAKLSSVLKSLEYTGVNFRIEGNRMIVMNNNHPQNIK